jgi:hypothetical protein
MAWVFAAAGCISGRHLVGLVILFRRSPAIFDDALKRKFWCSCAMRLGTDNNDLFLTEIPVTGAAPDGYRKVVG